MSIKKLVQSSYDKIGHMYDEHRDIHKIDKELQMFLEVLPENAYVLDAGSGAGRPTSDFLTKNGINVMGIDISEKMINLAKVNVPKAEFQQGDMKDLKFPPETFDGVISLFSLFHVPREKHEQVLRGFQKILKKGGTLLINTGTTAHEGITRFFGEPMFWSNYDPKITLRIVKMLGFQIIMEGKLFRGGEVQYWIFAKKM